MYARMTLNKTIEALRALPRSAKVSGLDDDIYSYRGYYDRNAVEPMPDVTYSARKLATAYERQIGKKIVGYKGGDYEVDGDQLLYVTPYGVTGPSLIGFEVGADGSYVPVLLDHDYYF